MTNLHLYETSPLVSDEDSLDDVAIKNNNNLWLQIGRGGTDLRDSVV